MILGEAAEHHLLAPQLDTAEQAEQDGDEECGDEVGM